MKTVWLFVYRLVVVAVMVAGVYQLQLANREIIEMRADLVETYARLGRVVAELEDVVAESQRLSETVENIEIEIRSKSPSKQPF